MHKIVTLGTANHPEVVQDNTESPEDETALTEIFDKISVDSINKDKRSKLQLPQVSFVIFIEFTVKGLGYLLKLFCMFVTEHVKINHMSPNYTL